jgi:glycosyltransferase involved in cell wall biosynthesis
MTFAPSTGAAAEIRTLYVCYFSLREPLVQTQVLPYLRGISRAGGRVWLLTFERAMPEHWKTEPEETWRARLRAHGIEWLTLPYHSRPSLPAKIVDIIAGTLRVIRTVRREGIAIIHARSHLAALISLLARPFTAARVIFDIRGLFADDYADAGHWRPRGLLYRITKRVETFLFRADGFVVLTDRARAALFPAISEKPIQVIPTCFDPDRWLPNDAPEGDIRDAIGAHGRTIIVYAGSLGGAYLTKELSEFFASARTIDDSAFLLIATHSSPHAIKQQLERAGVPAADFHIRYVPPERLPAYLSASDIAMCMVKPGYSKLAMSPTKFAEYLASGLPVISTRGIGDLDALIEDEGVGVLLDGFTAESYAKAFRHADALRKQPGFRDACREVARRCYDLESIGSARYLRLYRAISGSVDPVAVEEECATAP